MKLSDDTPITAEELLAVIQNGWTTVAEREVVEFAHERLRRIAKRVHERLGSHCEKCGHKL